MRIGLLCRRLPVSQRLFYVVLTICSARRLSRAFEYPSLSRLSCRVTATSSASMAT